MLSEYSSTWTLLQEEVDMDGIVDRVYYRHTQMGQFEFGAIEAFKELPDLSDFHCAHARNGGPIGKCLNS